MDDAADLRPSKRRRTNNTQTNASAERSAVDSADTVIEVAAGSNGKRKSSAQSKTPKSTDKRKETGDGAQRSARRVSRRLKAVAAEQEEVQEGLQLQPAARTQQKDDDSEMIDSAYASKEDSLVEGLTMSNNGAGAARSTLRAANSGESLEIPETPGDESEVIVVSGNDGNGNVGSGRQSKRGSRSKAKSSRTPAQDGVHDEAPVQKSSSRRKAISATVTGKETRRASGIATSTANAALAASKSEDELQEVEPTTTRQASSRSRKPPTRYSVEPQSNREPTPLRVASLRDVAASASPQPKGILTPSKGRKNTRPKSVVFDPDEAQIREQLGFKDIDQSVKKPRKSSRTAEVTTYAEDEDVVGAAAVETSNAIDPILDFDQPLDLLQSLEQTNVLPRPAEVEDSSAVTAIKSRILSQLVSATPTQPAPHLASQQATLTNLLRSTIVSGESNSLLMLGPRGAGKTLLLEHVLKELDEEHSSLFHTVRLNGFFQTDDRLALREIWRQLGHETQEAVEGDAPVTTTSLSYADTLASLLSLLAHPDEVDADLDIDMLDGENDTGTKTAKSTIIILDEFDLFTLHPRQTLLYNLFDIAQSRKAPIAVIGCSTRMDVVESLEKRVKSRFSHRWLHVPPVRTLEEMAAVVEAALTIPKLDEDGDIGSEGLDTDIVAVWNDNVKTSFLASSVVKQHITQAFHGTKSVPDTLAALYAPITTLSISSTSTDSQRKNSKSKSNKMNGSTLSAQQPESVSDAIITSMPLPTTSTTRNLTILTTALALPPLHLALLATLSSPSYPSPAPSFHTTFLHYQFLLQRTKLLASSGRASLARTTGAAAGVRQWGRKVCQSAWEEMTMELGILSRVGGAGGGDSGAAVDEWAGVRVELDEEDVLWVLQQREGGKGRGAGGEMGVYVGWVRGDVV